MILDLTPVSGTPQKISTDSILWFYDDGSGNYFAAVAYYSRFASVLQIAEDPAALAGAVGPNFITLTHDTFIGLYINCDLIGRIEDVGGTDTLIVMKVGDVYQAEITVAETVGDVETAINDAGVPPGSVAWGGITGTLSDQLDLQAEFNIKVSTNAPITPATKTKITYDTKGLVTAGADATTSDIAEGSNLYHTEPRVRATPLTGLSVTGSAVISTDTVLQAFGKLQNQVNAVAGGVNYQGVWNSSTNSPALTSSVGTKGYYYVVSVPGSTNLDGLTDWKLGDWAIFNGITWAKVDNTDAVISVNGYTGIVALTATDVGAPSGSGNSTGTNTGDQTSIVGITGTKAQFDSACSDGNFLYSGDAVPYSGASSNLDLATRSLILSSGQIGIGATPAANIQLEISSDANTATGLDISMHGDDIFSGVMLLKKSRGTHALPTSLASADRLGFLGFSGRAGSAYATAAAIVALAEEAFAAGTYGAALVFETATIGGGSPTRTARMKIHPSGNVSIGSSLTNNSYRLEVTGNSRVLGSSTSSGNALIVGDSGGTAIATFTNAGATILRGLTATQASALTPSAGMIIYVTSTDATFTSAGYWVYQASWQRLYITGDSTVANGFGLTGTTTKAVALTTAEAFCTAETTISAVTYADITGASISLAAGTWLIMATINGASQTTTVAVMMAAITDSANTVVAESSKHIVAGTATVRTWGSIAMSAIVSPGSPTTYKLRGARGTTTQTGNWIASDGNGVNTANNVSNNSDKGTSIRAIRIA